MAPGTVQLHIYSCKTKLTRYVQAGQTSEGNGAFSTNGMRRDDTFVWVLNACAGLEALEEGRCIHTQIIQCDCESGVHVASSLVNMYAKCRSIHNAWRVFHEMTSHDVVYWTAMILWHVKCGQGQKALELFQQMQQEGVRTDGVTFVGVLNACASVVALDKGRVVHEQIIWCSCESDVFVDMYTKCGSMDDAWRVFNKMPACDLFCWNAMIFGDVKCGQGQNATELELFQQMQQKVSSQPCHFCGDPKCMCQCSSTWIRRCTCPSTYHSNWLGVWCLCWQ
jgi:pentatricopeptide repeat protein